MKFKNYDIYQNASKLAEGLKDLNVYIPVKANFLLQKNIDILTKAAQEIEERRLDIAKHYGVLDEEKQLYAIPQEKMVEANEELNNLFLIEQDIEIKKFTIEDLGDTQFTPAQMQAIMFMIEE